MPFIWTSAAIVVLNRVAMPSSVSPICTVYIVYEVLDVTESIIGWLCGVAVGGSGGSGVGISKTNPTANWSGF